MVRNVLLLGFGGALIVLFVACSAPTPGGDSGLQEYRPPPVLRGSLLDWRPQHGSVGSVATMSCDLSGFPDTPPSCGERLLPIEFALDGWGRFELELPELSGAARALLDPHELCGVPYASFWFETIYVGESPISTYLYYGDLRPFDAYLPAATGLADGTVGTAAWMWLDRDPPAMRCQFSERTLRVDVHVDLDYGWNFVLYERFYDPQVGYGLRLRRPSSKSEYESVAWVSHLPMPPTGSSTVPPTPAR
jgi:hypothetical protein